VPVDRDEAFKWLRLAVENGKSEAADVLKKHGGPSGGRR
jgi:hypothetical protein